jgi:membrane fusion protein (multidrug efflux system)
VKDRVLQKVALNVREKDVRSGEFVLNSGVEEGDSLLRYPTATLHDGQPVEMTESASSAPVLAERTTAAGR